MESRNNEEPNGAGRQEKARILVVDDEPIIREVLSDYLSAQGYFVRTAENGVAALQELTKTRFRLVLTDLKMPVMGGAELLAELVRRGTQVTVIVMTAYATVETAIQTMKNGAYDYIMKPFKMDEITLIVERALEKDRLQRENIQLKEAKRLYQISEAMSSTLSLDKVLKIIVQSAKREAGASVASLVLLDPGQGRWHSEICDSDVDGIVPADLDECLDMESLLRAHREGRAVIHPPMDMRPFTKKAFVANMKPHSFISVPLAMHGDVTGMLNVFSFTEGNLFLEGERKSLYVLGSRAAIAVENARLHEDLKAMFLQTIEGFAYAIDAKDPYTLGHSRRVTRYCEWIAGALGLDEKQAQRIRHAATLHDIGKIGLRQVALNKPAALSPEEEEEFRTHTKKGCKILAPIHFFEELIPIIYHHHEHWDGGGYPEGKSGTQIPLGARIIAVADAYDAMTSDRSYRKAMNACEASRELVENAGKQFDPDIVRAFTGVLEAKAPEERVA